jgi:hypothetical protein
MSEHNASYQANADGDPRLNSMAFPIAAVGTRSTAEHRSGAEFGFITARLGTSTLAHREDRDITKVDNCLRRNVELSSIPLHMVRTLYPLILTGPPPLPRLLLVEH